VTLKVCIVGAGAVGGFIGAKLAAAGQAEVSALARGATLAALQQRGWRVESRTGDLRAPARASDDPQALGAQDVVVIAVKEPSLASVAPRLAPLLEASTVVVPAMNGVPWWFCRGLPGFDDPWLRSVDPQGTIDTAIPFAAVVGCVVYLSASSPEPGLVRHATGTGLIVGEPLGGGSARVDALVRVLADAGLDAKASPDVRHEIWNKLLGNLAINPVSALTEATVDRILADREASALCAAAIGEAMAIGARLGFRMTQTPEQRLASASRLGAFRSSMLQDVDAGRRIELDAIVGAVHEIGMRLAIPMPAIGALLGLTRLFARSRGLY
jgi:2-dehydropantoate 2-reductase